MRELVALNFSSILGIIWVSIILPALTSWHEFEGCKWLLKKLETMSIAEAIDLISGLCKVCRVRNCQCYLENEKEFRGWSLNQSVTCTGIPSFGNCSKLFVTLRNEEDDLGWLIVFCCQESNCLNMSWILNHLFDQDAPFWSSRAPWISDGPTYTTTW